MDGMPLVRTTNASEAVRDAINEATSNRGGSVDAILTDTGETVYEAYRAGTGIHQPGDRPWYAKPGERMLCTVPVEAGDDVESAAIRVRSAARAAIDRLRAGSAHVNARDP